jgi:hypothetical protein
MIGCNEIKPIGFKVAIVATFPKYCLLGTIILPVFLYVCETWSLTLREEPRLRVFGSRVLRRIFDPKRDEVMGDWRKLYNEECHNL